MKIFGTIRVVIVFSVLFLSLSAAAIQEQPPAEGEDSSGQVVESSTLTADDSSAHTIDIDNLRLNALPLRREALVEIVEQWVQLVEEKSQELVSTQVSIKAASGADKTELQEQAAQLRLEKTALIERAKAMVNALSEKGGDVEEFNQYLSAVDEVAIDVTDTSAAWISFKTWLRSPDGGIRVGFNILKFIGTLIAFWILSRIIGKVVHRAVTSFKKTSNLLREFLAGIARRATLAVGAVVALSMLGVNITPLIAAIGAAGLVIGLALQGTLSNFASGIMILLYRPFDVGDVVTVENVTGKVRSMTLVSTTILTFDNQLMIVPNNSVWDNVITNITGMPTRRVDLTVGIGYDSDIEKARSILKQLCQSHELVLADPEPIIEVSELGDSSVNLIARPWVKTADYWRTRWDLTADIKKHFDADDIVIPYPQMDVHLQQELSELKE